MSSPLLVINMSVLSALINAPKVYINTPSSKYVPRKRYHNSLDIIGEIKDYKRITGGKCVILIENSNQESAIRNIMEGNNAIDDIFDITRCHNNNDYLCFKSISNKINILPQFIIYIDNDIVNINNVKNVIFWSYYCEGQLTREKFREIVAEYSNTIMQMRNIINLPENSYIDDTYAKNFISMLRNTNIKVSTSNNPFIGIKNKICCDQEYIKYCIDLINIFGKDKEIHIPYKRITDEDTLNTIEYYYTTIAKYTNYGGIVYSLGDSLDKFNFVWNVNQTSQEKLIVSVPFSGSMYDDIENSTKIVADQSLASLMYSRAIDLYNNNSAFSSLFTDILTGKFVLITDFGHSGKALITITKLINYLASLMNQEINWDKVTYLQITPSRDIIEENITEHLIDEPAPTVIYYDTYLDSYFTNSDRWVGGYNSRCIPRYEVTTWTTQPDDVWKNGFIGNYKLCNIHRILLLFQLCCHYTRVINNFL